MAEAIDDDLWHQHPIHLDPRSHREEEHNDLLAKQRQHHQVGMDLCDEYTQMSAEMHRSGMNAMTEAGNLNLRRHELRDHLFRFCDEALGLSMLGEELVREVRRKEWEMQRLHQEIYRLQTRLKRVRADRDTISIELVGCNQRNAELNRDLARIQNAMLVQTEANNELRRQVQVLEDRLGIGKQSTSDEN